MTKQERLIDYLYGEMEDMQRREFEQMLANDPALQAELAALQQTRQWLSGLPEVQPEPLVLPMPTPKISWRKWSRRAGIAASVLLLLSLLQARVEVSKQGFVFSLGQPAGMETPVPSPSVDLQQRLAQNEQELDRKLQQLDSLWQSRLVAHQGNLQRDWQTQLAAYRNQRQQDLAHFARQLNEKKMPELAGLVQNLQLEQQEELRSLLAEFWGRWQDTRTSDLQSIQQEFVNLYRNVQRNQTETEALIQDILARGNL